MRGKKKSKKQKTVHYVADFETVVDENTTVQKETDVWAFSIVPVGGAEEQAVTGNRLADFMAKCESLAQSGNKIVVYFHNLKFDGSFILSWCFRHGYKNAVNLETKELYRNPEDMPCQSVSYLISDMGIWYDLIVKFPSGVSVKFQDSLKLLPFSVKRIGQAFSSHKKLEIEYKGKRYAGWSITEQERKYIVNDVLVVSEALDYMFKEGHDKMTIGSCCLSEYKRLLDGGKKKKSSLFDELFPDLSEIPLDSEIYGSPDVDAYIRKAYKGGWCYLKPEMSMRELGHGVTADVNSLYPSVMSGESRNLYPYGTPVFWTGAELPEAVSANKRISGKGFDRGIFYYIRFKCRFKLKSGKLPCVQIKNSPCYNPEEWLETSDATGKDGAKTRFYIDANGQPQDTVQTLTMTGMDFELFRSHYDLFDFTILDGCYFTARSGLFDDYINKYRKIKMESKGAQRELAKLFLNNLYGKFATSPEASSRLAELGDDGVLKFPVTLQGTKKAGYVAIGAAVTSYARNFTIRAAQANFDRFVYADTDSIHCTGKPGDVTGIKVDPVKFLHWKLESTWDTAYFVRQKTYAEHVTESDCIPLDNPFWNLKCAGMNARTKELFLMTIDENFDLRNIDTAKYTPEELLFLSKKRKITDFAYGLTVPGQLKARQVQKGVLLKDFSFKLREKKQKTVKKGYGDL